MTYQRIAKLVTLSDGRRIDFFVMVASACPTPSPSVTAAPRDELVGNDGRIRPTQPASW